MQVCRRRALPGELDHELLWLSISLAGLAASALWLGVGLPWPHCLFLALTGHPCVTCGATRATMQFLHGHFATALRWNPLVFVALWAVIFFDAYAAVVLMMRWPRVRVVGLTNTEKNLVRACVLAALASNWIYLLATWRAHSAM